MTALVGKALGSGNSGGNDTCRVVSVAVSGPVRGLFDYLPPLGCSGDGPAAGVRVWVPFGNQHRLGIVTGARLAEASACQKLKHIDTVLDSEPLIDSQMLALALWSSDYYQHPLGDVLATMLPTSLRRKRMLPSFSQEIWRLTADGQAALPDLPASATRQAQLLERLRLSELAAADLESIGFSWRPVMQRVVARGWVSVHQRAEKPAPDVAPGARSSIELNVEQNHAAELIAAHQDQFQVILVDGVTGSGKTEVYLAATRACLERGKQALIMVPEITLTEHLVSRFRARFGERVVVLHSALSNTARLRAWQACRQGHACVLIGTRSAVWADLPELGLVVVDEEHDPSYKQQDGFRYSGRDVAIVRAHQRGIPIVLGSATPSLETLANVQRGRYLHVTLSQRARAQAPPAFVCLDVRGQTLRGGLSEALIRAMREHLDRSGQVMLFLNRRGYSPILMCRSCGEPWRCDRCDAYLVFHKQEAAARCHHCDRRLPMRRGPQCCPAKDIAPIGQGTERLAEIVSELFPGQQVCRLDRDTARSPAAVAAMLEEIERGEVNILIGTQMIAKGLDFSDVTLVGIVDADSRLYALDFRSEERLAQVLIQVAGRAGRAAKPGTVMIQTYQPNHPVLRRIIDEGYPAFAEAALRERQEAGLPPYTAMAVVRAESSDAKRPLAFLREIREQLITRSPGPIELSYPVSALMERRAGRYRALLALRAGERSTLGGLLRQSMDSIDASARRWRVRCAVDVDPHETL